MKTYIKQKTYNKTLPVKKYTIKNEIIQFIEDAGKVLHEMQGINKMCVEDRQMLFMQLNSLVDEIPHTIKLLKNLKTRDKG